MSNGSAKFIVALIAAATLATAAELRAQTSPEKAAAEKVSDDKCLSAPKGAGPAGSHWFYRIDHATKRQCWYLKEAGDKSARSKPPEPAPVAAATNPAAPPLTITQKSIANARAEWLSQQARPQAAAAAEPQTGAPDRSDDRRNIGSNVLVPAPLATTRWPKTTAASNATDAASADAPAREPQETEEAQQPAPLALASIPTELAKPTASLQMLLLAIAAALAVAGITVSLMFRIGRARARRAMRRKREAMWESVPSSRPQTSVRRSPQLQPLPRAEPQRAPRPRLPDDREQQMNDMLARLARSAQRAKLTMLSER
ncbi:MAG: hypothetical protein PS018_13180 [bacterium]|nr:hypothetical protein [bacterium]